MADEKEGVRLTPAQKRALVYLSGVEYASPAELGYETEDRAARTKHTSMKPQGAGRLGGAMGTKLITAGLAQRHHTHYRGTIYSVGYAITQAGRRALAAGSADGGEHV